MTKLRVKAKVRMPERPTFDFFEHAVPLPVEGGRIDWEVAGTGIEPAEPNIDTVQRTVWFKRPAGEAKRITFAVDQTTPAPSGFVPTYIFVYTGSGFDGAGLTEVTSSGVFNSVTFDAEANTDYYIQVGAPHDGANGWLYVSSYVEEDIPVAQDLYVSMLVKFNATWLDKTLNGNNTFTGNIIQLSSDLIEYGQELLIAQKSGGSSTQYQFGLGFSNEADFRFGPVLSAATWYNVDLWEKSDGSETVVRIDGVEYVNDVSGIWLPGENEWNFVHVGHRDAPSDQNGTKDIDTVTIGTTAYDTSDILSEDFSGTLPGNFDSKTDPDGRLSIVSSALHFTGGTSSVDEAYLSKAV